LFKTPTFKFRPAARPIEFEDRAWFGELLREYRWGMVDPKTRNSGSETRRVGRTYPLTGHNKGDPSVSGMSKDLILRLNPETGQSSNIMLPTWTQYPAH